MLNEKEKGKERQASSVRQRDSSSAVGIRPARLHEEKGSVGTADSWSRLAVMSNVEGVAFRGNLRALKTMGKVER